MSKRSRFKGHPDGSVSLIPSGDGFSRTMENYLSGLRSTSEHYRKILDSTVGWDVISPLETFDRFPVTEKAQYRDTVFTSAFDTVGQNQFVTDFSSGSTAQSVLRLCRPFEDLCEQAVTEQVFRRAGIGPADHFVCLDIGAPEIYDFYFRAARRLGVPRCNFLHVSEDFPSLRDSLKRLRPSVLLTTPTILAKLWDKVGGIWGSASPVRKVIHIGEDMGQKFKAEIERRWNCQVFSFYGTTEIGGLGSHCSHGDGLHFDNDYFIPTLLNPTMLGEDTIEGEVLFTTLRLQIQSVVKYRVGDIVRVTRAPCPCGEETPRLWFKERTHDSFVLAGEKFRYETFYSALKAEVADLTFLSIEIGNDETREEKIILKFKVSESLRGRERQLIRVLKEDIFELDAIYRYGLIDYEIEFEETDLLASRKTKRIIDRRQWVGTEAQAEPRRKPAVLRRKRMVRKSRTAISQAGEASGGVRGARKRPTKRRCSAQPTIRKGSRASAS